MYRIHVVACMLLVVLLSGCAGSGSAATDTPATAPRPTTPATAPAPTPEPSPTATAAPSRPPASFEAATYRDESAGFELDYPSAWTLSDQILGGDRGSVVQFIWDGQPRLDVTVLRWDQSRFPPLGGQPPRGLFGPGANIVTVIYSESWGRNGAGAALLFIARNQSGAYYWHGLIYSDGHFDKP